MEKSFVLTHGELKIPCKLLAPDDGQIRRLVLDLTRDWFEFEQVLCCDWE